MCNNLLLSFDRLEAAIKSWIMVNQDLYKLTEEFCKLLKSGAEKPRNKREGGIN